MKPITVPDIGDFKDVPVIEVLVAVGDTVAKNQPLAVVETDKATMEIPSPESGVVASVEIKVGDRVSAGAQLLMLAPIATAPAAEPVVALPLKHAALVAASTPPALARAALPQPTGPLTETVFEKLVYAGPAVRKLARELGVNLYDAEGSGPRGRIVANDVHRYVQSVVAAHTRDRATGGGAVLSAANTPFNLLPWPKVDHGKFGTVEAQPLSRIRKISGANLHRNWVTIPHVTNHDDADVTELESFRNELNRGIEKGGMNVSPLAFIVKACVAALKAYPDFNASLEGETLILKRYYNIGFAADTPHGLVVPVIRDADGKGVVEIAKEMADLAAKARAGKLSGTDIQGGSFSISSLGGIGGSYFTPIINAPEVAILGVGKIQTRVIWADGRPQPRLYLPLSLSWDHRVVDGAAAGRFNACLVRLIGDLRRLLL